MLWITIAILGFIFLAYQQSSLIVWALSTVLYLGLLTGLSNTHWLWLGIFWIGAILIFGFLLCLPLRRVLFSKNLYRFYRKHMPTISETERAAIEAGTVRWDREIFSGAPNWKILTDYPKPALTEEEQAFIDGPVQELCSMLDDWAITHEDHDLSPGVWAFLRKEGFFGFIIPKAYGGKAFSAFAVSQILSMLNGVSITAGTTVTVPNSLGPAELLLKYGTDAQKDYFLPRLASGEEIPCFALTSPVAGSDAGALPDHGVICRETYQGKETLGIRLQFNKRYITLAPVATIIGLAFKLFDPDHLFSEREDWGITCALIPRDTKGITIGARHFPLNHPFQNGPIRGEDVFIPFDCVIGGEAQFGKGWRMLMECLAEGRGVSLPAGANGGAKVATFTSGAYARIREQFNLPIGRFEGVAEKLAEIAGKTYIIDSARRLVASMIDNDEQPAVFSAIVKYHTTELGRDVSMAAMDVHGGKGICLGPKNYLGRGYQGVPIGITVEGANILTRGLMIFGQGATRCHPYIFETLMSVYEKDEKQGLKQFDHSFFGHMGLAFSNLFRTVLLSLSLGTLARPPHSVSKPARKYYRKLMRFSAAFAFTADITLGLLGGALKKRELISGRLGDIFSSLMLMSAVLKHFEDQAEPDLEPVMRWSCETLLNQLYGAFLDLFANYPNKTLAVILKVMAFPFGCRRQPIADLLTLKLSESILENTKSREKLVEGIYLPDVEHPFAHLKTALNQALELAPIYKKIKQAKINGLNGLDAITRIEYAKDSKIITEEEATACLAFERLRQDIIAVDSFYEL